MNKAKFKKQLAINTDCKIQYNGWCCGTCFFSLNEIFNLKGRNKLNNKDWQSLLLYRGDYEAEELSNLPKDFMQSIEKIWNVIK